MYFLHFVYFFRFLLYSTNMAWIRLVLVVFCIGSIHGLPQEIANPSDDSKPSDLTKNPTENPSSVDSKPSDLTEVVLLAMKLALEFIWNQVNAAISGNWNPDAFWEAFDNALMYTYASLATHFAISFHNQGVTLRDLFHMN